MAKIEEPKKQAIDQGLLRQVPAEIQAILKKPRRAAHARRADDGGAGGAVPRPVVAVVHGAAGEAGRAVPKDKRQRWEELKRGWTSSSRCTRANCRRRPAWPTSGPKAPPMHLLHRGQLRRAEGRGAARVPVVLDRRPARSPRRRRRRHGRRAAARRWRTGWPARQPADRPRDGQPHLAVPLRPRHRRHAERFRHARASRRRTRELLDWLAGEFVAQGWSMKAMHRLILNSRDLPAVLAPTATRCGRGRPRRQAPVALPPPAAGGGGHPRRGALGRRPAQREDVRPERVPRTAPGRAGPGRRVDR